MSPSPKEQAQTEQFAAIYRRNQLPVMRSVERQVCGCDYGGTSWTTRKEADEIAGLLGLREGVHLLDLGSGSGWPALYWAETTGCNTVLTDLPFDSLRLAARRELDHRRDCRGREQAESGRQESQAPHRSGPRQLLERRLAVRRGDEGVAVLLCIQTAHRLPPSG